MIWMRARWTSMKKDCRRFILPAIIIIIAGFFSGFGERSYGQIAEELLKERTKILQHAYYGGIEPERAEKYLSRIETYPLLSEDIENLRDMEATDLDLVKSMDFLEVKQEQKLFHYVSLRMKIRWHMSGAGADYVSENEYSVILQTAGNESRLAEFTAFPRNY